MLAYLTSPTSQPPGYRHPNIPIQFGEADRFEAITSINHRDGILAGQAAKLAENIQRKRTELIRHAIKRRLGRFPTLQEAAVSLELVQFRPRLPIRLLFRRREAPATWIYWQGNPVAVMTEPHSRTSGKSGHLYYLGFYFQTIADPAEN